MFREMLTEIKVIEPDVFGDNRGWFYESYNKQKFSKIVEFHCQKLYNIRTAFFKFIVF